MKDKNEINYQQKGEGKCLYKMKFLWQKKQESNSVFGNNSVFSQKKKDNRDLCYLAYNSKKIWHATCGRHIVIDQTEENRKKINVDNFKMSDYQEDMKLGTFWIYFTSDIDY